MRINRHVIRVVVLALLLGIFSPVAHAAYEDNPAGPTIKFTNVDAGATALPTVLTIDYFTPTGVYTREAENFSRTNGTFAWAQAADGEYYFIFDAVDWQHYAQRTIYVHVVSGVITEVLDSNTHQDVTVTSTVPAAAPSPAFNVYQISHLSAFPAVIKVTQPAGGAVEVGGYWQTQYFDPSNGQTGNYFSGNEYSIDGSATIVIPAGDFVLRLYPNTNTAGISNNYYVHVTSLGVVTMSPSPTGSPEVSKDASTYLLPLAFGNITGVIKNTAANGSGNMISDENSSVTIFLQKKNGGTWLKPIRVSNTWTDGSGGFKLNAPVAGTYRLNIQTYGYPNTAETFSDEIVFSDSDISGLVVKALGNIVINAPTLQIKVMNGASPVLDAWVDLLDSNGYWVSNTNTGSNGIANFAISTAGNYKIRVNPSWNDSTHTSKEYAVVATAGTPITAVITGQTATAGIYSLALGTPTLSGTVFKVGGTTPLANVRVIAKNLATGEEMWQQGANSSSNGTWAMSLPLGTYSIKAETPYKDIVNTDSESFSTITVDAQGVATLSGTAAALSTTAFNLTMKSPRWTGTIKTPSSVLLEGANVCIFDAEQNYQSCSTSDSLGRWALGAPTAVNTYSTKTWVVYSTWPAQYPERRFNNGTEVAVGLGAATGATGVNLAFAAPNFSVTINAGSAVVANAGVSLMQDNTWIGWSNTNENGVASWTGADLTKQATVMVQVNNTTVSQTFTATTKTFTSAEVVASAAAHSAIFTEIIALDTPNFFGVLRQPTVGETAGAAVPYSNVDLRLNGSNGPPLTNTNTDNAGAFSLNIPKPASGSDLEYTMTVYPAWNSLLPSSKTQYDVTVSSTNVVTVKLNTVTNTTGTNPSVAATPYALVLSAPSVSGTVVRSDGTTPQADSYVIPINHSTGEWLGNSGTNSKSDGSFGISLPDGTYDMQALKPWNSSNLSKSALCAITVAGGAVTTTPSAGTCVPTANTLKLALRAPNLTMTLKDATGAAVAFANVGLQVGNWYTNETSGSDGTVGLNIDRAAIIAANGAMADSTKINVYVDPPWGTSTVVGWRCQSGDAKEVCKTSGGIGAFNVNSPDQTFALGDVSFSAPNTTIHIKTPNVTPPAGVTWTQNTSVGAGAWVWLSLSGNTAANAIGWIGANTDSNGDVKFNIDAAVKADATTRYRVDIYPPWNGAVGLSQKTYDNKLITEIEDAAGLALNSPNTFITVNVPAGTATTWGWIGVEEVDAANNNAWIAWQGGYGLSQTGKVALTLSASKRYRITAYPNKTGAGFGTATSCFIDTSSEIVVTKATGLCDAVVSIAANNTFTLTLSAGNVTGTVTRATGGTAVANATIYATSGAQVVSTTTSATGTFALNLDNTLNWIIKILPFNVTGATPLVAVTTLEELVQGFGATALTPTVANA